MSMYESRFTGLSVHEQGITNRQRRALKGPSQEKRRAMAQSAQRDSNMRIRIARRVINHLDFKPELAVWRDPVEAGIAQRKSLGALSMTVFDSNQQPLRACREHTQESLEEEFRAKYPALFEDTPPIPITGTSRYGSLRAPFIVATFGPGHAFEEIKKVRTIVAPELSLGSDHLLEHSPHLSLGKVFVASQVQAVRDALEPVLPTHAQFGPATIQIARDQQ